MLGTEKVAPEIAVETEEKLSMEKDFLQNTSCHGLGRIGSTEKWGIKRIVWFILVLIALGFALEQVIMRLIEFFSWKTSSTFERKFNSTMYFPAITFCNFNRYEASRLTAADIYVIENGQNAFLGNSLLGYTYNYTAFEANITALYPGGFDFGNFTKEKGFQLDNQTLVTCALNHKPCDLQDFTPILTDMGLCHTFNSGGSTRFSQSVPGSFHGLTLGINVQQDEYFPTPLGSDSAGIRFLVHPHYEYPDVLKRGYAVSPGTHAFAAMKYGKRIEADGHYGNCDKKSSLQYFERYSYFNCLVECETLAVVRGCGCRYLAMPERAHEKVCSPTVTWTCALSISEQITSNVHEKCPQCIEPCVEEQYEVELSSALYPSTAAASEVASTFNISVASLRDNVLLLEIFFKELSFIETTKSAASTPTQLISDLGGQLGLWMGISILTIAEFIEYLILKCRAYSQRRAKR